MKLSWPGVKLWLRSNQYDIFPKFSPLSQHKNFHFLQIDGLTVTPFERNLAFWRQLWRVVERSDIVVQIADARNPLLFRCEDLEVYVKEVGGAAKLNFLLLNKADLLTEAQRNSWADYFRQLKIPIAFWSALADESATTTIAEETSEHSGEHEMQKYCNLILTSS